MKIFKKTFVCIFLLSIIFSCKLINKPTQSDYFSSYTPPGTVKIANNFYFDQTENRNIDYLEYLFWNARVFGKESKEYIEALPDTTVWKENDPCLHKLCTTYLRHSFYHNYPTIGVTMQQAKMYSKWRSDRVFEWLLISFGKIQFNQKQTRDNYFSIDNYFSGKYNNTKPDTCIHWVPCYYLPNNAEWELALIYKDSTSFVYDKKVPFQSDQININPCVSDSLYHFPLRSCSVTNKKHKSYPLIYDLFGNASEFINNDTASSIGGSWKDDTTNLFTEIKYFSKPNSYTGFRNSFKWVFYQNSK